MTFLLPEGVSDTFQPMVAVSRIVLQHLHCRREKRFVTPITRQCSIALLIQHLHRGDRTWSSTETLVLTKREKAAVPQR